ncbi:hypothetical protein FACS189426_09050 [Bacteroidia bacterium]|nr:hypothetical protein FACS189426_09050 [Bacteroidia bacterium]
MKTNFLLWIACFLAFSTTAQTPQIIAAKEIKPDTYTYLWDKVAQLEEQSLPQSGLEIVNQIYHKALDAGDSPELIKALIFQLKYETVIDKDKLPDKIVEIERFVQADKNKVEQAVLYSLLAELYQNYYQAHSREINQRTAVQGDAPKDLREWPANLFIQKVADCVNGSLQPAKELQNTNVLDYKNILTEGESSRILRPTLYDFLVHRGIDLLNRLVQDFRTQNYFLQTKLSAKENFAPVKEFVNLSLAANEYDFVPQILKLYRQLLVFRQGIAGQARNDKDGELALLMADLDRLAFVRINSQIGESSSEYINALKQLKKQYTGNDFCVEILYKEASFYYENRNQVNTYSNDSFDKQRNDNLREAYEICLEGIKKYSDYKRIGLLKNLLSEITQSSLFATSENAIYPGKDLELKIRYKNFNQLRIEIYQIKAPVSVYLNDWTRNGQYEKTGTLVKTETIGLANIYPYLEQDTTIKIPMTGLGNYEYAIYADSLKREPANQQFSVSRLAVVSRGFNGKGEYLVVDRLSGKPIEKAYIQFYKRKSNYLELAPNKTLVTDKLGLAFGDGERDVDFYQVSFGNDTALITSPVPWISTYNDNPDAISHRLNIFTDRSIYRPGQTVYFKGIAYETGKNRQQVSPNKKYTVIFRDANGKEIAKQELTTNEFGSLHGEFVVPQGLLTGNFSIQSEDGAYMFFRVEEYKRPTFDIRFDKNEKAYRFGDEITVEGEVKSFSGINKPDATVQYRITRRNHGFYTRNWREPVQITSGNVQTGADGKFKISFVADKIFEDKDSKHVAYTYEIEATITDTNGETQNAKTTVSIGDISINLRITNLLKVIDKNDFPSIIISALNLNGNPVQVKGIYEIYSLKLNDKSKLNWEPEDWSLDKKVLSGSFDAGKEMDILLWKSLPSGHYRLIAKTKGETESATSETQQDFSLASTKDKKPPIPAIQWLMTPKTTCESGEKAEIIYGSSAKNVYVLYEIFQQNGKKIAASRFTLNNENRKIEIPFLESYRDGITACFTFIKDEEIYTSNVPIQRKQPDKKLTLKMDVFRDKLLPGQTEEWKISVKDIDEKPVLAELLAGMYDASLDKLFKHSWNFAPIFGIRILSPNFNRGTAFGFSNSSISIGRYFEQVLPFSFSSFNWFGFNISNDIMYVYDTVNSQLRVGNIAAEENAVELSPKKSTSTGAIMIRGLGADNNTALSDLNDPIQIRQNFNETAFFYPQLKTNEVGETLISFTVPESNTTWKFMGLAHTKDLKYGQIIETAISQKQLMVTPNIPRFIREGDKTTVSSNISNLSESAVSGTVSIECFDPNTNQTNIVIPESAKTFRLEAGKTVAVSWTFDVPAGIDLTALKIIARSENFSDGEQHWIPVLPNRMLITESLPLNILGSQTKTFSFDGIGKNNSQTLENYRLTLEFASNPIWYAVQALPSIQTPQSENVISWFAAYYSNTLAVQIANSAPKIKQIIDVWTKQGGTKETLLSNLEKNQELKAVLLEETPWVLDAQNETEQKQRLALLFDINRSNRLNAQALEKIKSLQGEDGGWSWFKGMGANVFITQWGLYCLKDFKDLKDFKELTVKAVHFIDSRFKQHYDNLKKYNPNWAKTNSISTYELEYLFVRSFYKEIPFGEADEAAKFYTSLAEKYWANNTNLYDRAIAATILQRNGNTKTAASIVKSLREHASHKPDLGMFWANNDTRTFAFQSATCVHTFIMEAFQATGSSQKETDEMKLWLLKQKQTQEWESVPATVNAINILLKTGTNWLESEGKTTIQIGSKTIDTSKGEAGTGYVKEVFDAKSITPEMSRVKITKEDAAPGWGALYWQYFEDLDKIKTAKTTLNIEKSLFIEKNSATGKSLVPVAESNPLKVGDKIIVRLVVRADRDFEYVLLKDMRASCFEPVEQLSGIRWAQSTMYYQSPRDASMNFYFNNLAKGTYVFEYPLYVTSRGDYSNGVTTIQCLYAPEFVSHTSGGRVLVK